MRRSVLGGINYVIIGNSAAGLSAARALRGQDCQGKITVISDEPTFGYSRVLLPLYIGGRIRKKNMIIAPREFYTHLKIRLFRSSPVEGIDPKEQRVHVRDGKKIPYDRLLIATGSSPRGLDVPGKDLQGIHYLRKIADAEAIRRELSSSRGPVLLVGGGLIGVKTLQVLIGKKRKIHMVISSDQVLSQMLDKTASDFFLESFRAKGVDVHLPTDVRAFFGKERIEGALLSQGTTLPCSMAIVGKGVEPNVDPFRETALRLNRGIVVDQHLATDLPHVYAAGDVAEPWDLLQKKNLGNAIWPLALEEGRIAGLNMAMVPVTFRGSMRMNAVEIMGIKAVSAGEAEGDRVLKFHGRGEPVYRKLVFSGGRLIGFLLVGDIDGAGILTSLIRSESQVSPSDLEAGLERGFSYCPKLRSLGGSVQAFHL